MTADRPQERTSSGRKSARMRELYCKTLQTSDLSDQEIDEMRKHVGQLARVLCEHVWGKSFY